MILDKITDTRIDTAHPKVREELRKIYTEANNKLGKARLRFSHVLRTFKEQQALYDKHDGSTNAKAGQSFHNYGLAVDIVLLVDMDGNGSFETASWDRFKDWDKDTIPDWQEVVSVFKKYGWEYGGDWQGFKDYPHFQKTFGYRWQDLLAMYNSKKLDKEGYVAI